MFVVSCFLGFYTDLQFWSLAKLQKDWDPPLSSSHRSGWGAVVWISNTCVCPCPRSFPVIQKGLLCACVCARTSRVRLFCDPMCCSPRGFSDVPARLLEWVAISSFRGSPWPRNRTWVSCVSGIGRQIVYQLSFLGSPSYTYPCMCSCLGIWLLPHSYVFSHKLSLLPVFLSVLGRAAGLLPFMS